MNVVCRPEKARCGVRCIIDLRRILEADLVGLDPYLLVVHILLGHARSIRVVGDHRGSHLLAHIHRVEDRSRLFADRSHEEEAHIRPYRVRSMVERLRDLESRLIPCFLASLDVSDVADPSLLPWRLPCHQPLSQE